MGIRGYNYGRKKMPAVLPFVSTWDTTKAGSATNQIKLPLNSIGTYNFVVDWGDGTQSTITTYNQAETTHTYATTGVKTLSITGTIKGWSFNNAGDKAKLLSIQSWGPLQLGVGISITGYFYGCANLNLSGVTDVLNINGFTTLANAFLNCTAITTINRISEWDVSTITAFNWMFSSTNFNQDISMWNVSNVTDMSFMFSNTLNYTNAGVSLNAWNVSKVTSFNQTFYGCKYNMPLNLWITSACTIMTNMFGSNLAFNQDISMWNTANVTTMQSMFNGATNYTNASVSLNTWNVSNVTNMINMFTSSKYNMPLNLWVTSACTNMSSMFSSNSVFNQDISMWNTSNVINMSSMFQSATNYTNAGISLNTWNVSKVTNMSNMFYNSKYNMPLNLWITSACTNMSAMFQSNTAFNQDLSAWNVSNVTSMNNMFQSCNSYSNAGISLNPWNVSKVTTMTGMFYACYYNSPLNLWNISACTGINTMFYSNPAFNQDISAWDTSKVTNISGIFQGASNYANAGVSLNNWNVSKCTDFTTVFSNCKYNSPLNLWVTSGCTLMTNMFSSNSVFNQDISMWDTTKVTNMSGMFFNAFAFNQNIGNWNVSNVTNFTSFMFGKTPATLSAANLDAIYNGWSSRPVKPSLSITFGTANYTLANGQAGRNILTQSPNLWVINDGGGI